MAMLRTVTVFLTLLVALTVTTSAQETWTYTRQIKFPAADTNFVRPWLCATDVDGNLWVISSRATDTSAHDALFKAGPSDAQFTKVVDYTTPTDPFVGRGLRGVTCAGKDVFVCAIVGQDASLIYHYPQGDPTKKEAFGSGIGGSGYGTWIMGITATRDTFLYCGMGARVSFRTYNFNHNFLTGAAYGSYQGIVPYDQSPYEPGGPSTDGTDLIREVAVIPGANYYDSTTVFFTARNNSKQNPPAGGIAVWWGGTQTNPGPNRYQGTRALDPASLLTLGTFDIYGITADSKGRLYVTGPDSAFRWVKVFEFFGSFASEVVELPSQTSSAAPDPQGAPFLAPNDIALSPDEKTAYVIDIYARRAFVFKKGTVGINDQARLPKEYMLSQNFPNPFNPSTMITYELPSNDFITIRVCDLLGQELATLVNNNQSAGRHSVVFNANNLPSGVYIYALDGKNTHLAKRMTIVK
jgi:hypothetical protein